MMRFLSLALTLVPALVLAATPPGEPDPSRFPPDRRVIHEFHPATPGKVKIAFFDADSTLRVAPSGKPSANGPTDVAILPMLVEPLKKLEADGYLLAVVSNQAGVAAGFVTLETANSAMRFALQQLSRLGVRFHYYDFAEANDENRKPDIGMGKRLAGLIKSQLGQDVDWAHSIMVGDSGWKKGADVEPDGTPGEDVSNADRLFGENLAKAFGGVTYFHPRNYFHWLRFGVRNFENYQALVKFVGEHPDLDPGVNGGAAAPAPTASPAGGPATAAPR